MTLKVGNKVRFKNRNPDILLEITGIYRNIIMLKGVDAPYSGACAIDALEKVETKEKRKRAKQKKEEDFWL